MSSNTDHYRITLFFHDLRIGGAERVMLQLARGFIGIGHPVDLVLAHAAGPLLSEVPSGARIIDLGTRNPLMMFLRLLRYLRSRRPTALLSPFEVTSVIAILAKKLSGVPTRVVVRISTSLSLHKRSSNVKKIIERLTVSTVYPLADGIVAVSGGVAKDLAVYTGISLERITVIYNPVVTNQLLQDAEVLPDHPFFADDQLPVILGVGRLTEQKGFAVLIKAFEIVRRKFPSRLLILGNGEERPALETLIRSLGLDELIDLPGFTLNPFAFMRRASVFVLSSKWEGLPAVLIQAMACGCPVVSTDCVSGPSEILQDGRYGHLVPVGDVEAMASAIEAVFRGDVRKPTSEWREQYKIESALPQYKSVFGGEKQF